jgi:hypothetical protein
MQHSARDAIEMEGRSAVDTDSTAYAVHARAAQIFAQAL